MEIPNVMSEGRRHHGSFDIAPARKKRRRQRRADEGKRVAITSALTAVSVLFLSIKYGGGVPE